MADMAEAAEMPGDGVGRDRGRAFERPDTGSAFEDGQRPLTGFFLCTQPSRSASVFISVFREAMLLCEVVVETVESEADDETEPTDESEEDEFVLSGPFLGKNIRVTSSALIELRPL